MSIQNTSKNTTISHDAIEAVSFKQKSLGLISYSKPTAMIFRTRWGIHTFFMRYPIDVLILDKNKKVVSLKTNLKPYRIFVWNPKYDCIIELPQGTIKKSATQIHDSIKFLL